MEILYYCEKCGKPVYTKYGSGRFCSLHCSQSHSHTAGSKEKIKAGLQKECSCKYCGRQFTSSNGKSVHENLCKKNPDYDINRARMYKDRAVDKSKNYVMCDGSELDVSIAYVESYLEANKRCEICGRTIEETTQNPNNRFKAKRLCVDHDHTTNKFRGVLCQRCNRQLGWYESCKDAIDAYLNKSSDTEKK